MNERDAAIARLNALAGVDERGCILPPTDEDLAAGIDRRVLSFWRNPATAEANPLDGERLWA